MCFFKERRRLLPSTLLGSGQNYAVGVLCQQAIASVIFWAGQIWDTLGWVGPTTSNERSSTLCNSAVIWATQREQNLPWLRICCKDGANHLTTNRLLPLSDIFQMRVEARRFQDVRFRFINWESTVSIGGDSRLIIMATDPDGWLYSQSPAGPGSGQPKPYNRSNTRGNKWDTVCTL